MFLKDLGKIENSQFYLDLALKSAASKASSIRPKLRGKDRLARAKAIDSQKIVTVHKVLSKALTRIIENFPRFEKLPEFYYELVKATVRLEETRAALKSLDLTKRKLNMLSNSYVDKLRRCDELNLTESSKRAFYGRVSAAMKKTDKDLYLLDESRRVINSFPHIKTGLPTVVITGFPNVGKTTLLFKLSGSKPQIHNYAFTTKSINVSYLKSESVKVQLLDTPGTLDRVERMNNIEKQAYLAQKLLADCLVYVFDVTESYPLEDQIKLFLRIRKLRKPVLVYASKTDIRRDLTALEKFKPITEPDALKGKILSFAKNLIEQD